MWSKLFLAKLNRSICPTKNKILHIVPTNVYDIAYVCEEPQLI